MQGLSRLQAAMLAVLLVLGNALVLLPSPIFQVARRDGWMGFGLGLIFGLPAAWLLARTAKRFPDRPLAAVLVKQHPIAGRITVGGLIAFTFLLGITQLRTLTDFTGILLLPRTPLIVIGALIGVALIATARLGLVVIARMTQIFLPPLVALFFLVPMMLNRMYQPRLFQPVFEWGFGPALGGGLLALATIGQVLFVGLLVPFRTLGYHGLTAIGIAALLMTEVMFLTTLVMGPELGARFAFPIAELVRHTRLTDFLDRWDLFMIGIYQPSGFVAASTHLYVIGHGLHLLWPALKMQDMVLPVGLVLYASSVWFFESPSQIAALLRTWTPLTMLFFLVLPGLLWLFLRPKAAKKQQSPSA